MEAVGNKTLPIRPGDLLLFQASGHRMLVVCATEQCHAGEGVGQHIAGITSATLRWWWDDFMIEWAGLNTVWTIHRI